MLPRRGPGTEVPSKRSLFFSPWHYPHNPSTQPDFIQGAVPPTLTPKLPSPTRAWAATTTTAAATSAGVFVS